jgi:divalent metal cation (Fe/Co/Zn/Cd) transporter
MDAVEPELVDRAERSLLGNPGVLGVRALRMRWIGHRLHAEADLDIDRHVTITDAHRLAHEAEHQLTHDLPELRTAAIHAYPAMH